MSGDCVPACMHACTPANLAPNSTQHAGSGNAGVSIGTARREGKAQVRMQERAAVDGDGVGLNDGLLLTISFSSHKCTLCHPSLLGLVACLTRPSFSMSVLRNNSSCVFKSTAFDYLLVQHSEHCVMVRHPFPRHLSFYAFSSFPFPSARSQLPPPALSPPTTSSLSGQHGPLTAPPWSGVKPTSTRRPTSRQRRRPNAPDPAEGQGDLRLQPLLHVWKDAGSLEGREGVGTTERKGQTGHILAARGNIRNLAEIRSGASSFRAKEPKENCRF